MGGVLLRPNYTIHVATDAGRARLPRDLRVGSSAGVVLVALTPKQAVRLAGDIEARVEADALKAKGDELMLRVALIERRGAIFRDLMLQLGWWVYGLLAAVEIHDLFSALLKAVL